MCQLEKGLGGGFLRGELEDEYLFLNTDQVYSASQKKKKIHLCKGKQRPTTQRQERTIMVDKNILHKHCHARK